jgi:hypothetical protein
MCDSDKIIITEIGDNTYLRFYTVDTYYDFDNVRVEISKIGYIIYDFDSGSFLDFYPYGLIERIRKIIR